MMTPIRIRPVRSGDWSQFESLVAGICTFHGDKHGLTRSQFDDFATRANAPVTVLVAETEEGALVGFVAGFAIYSFQEGRTNFEIQNLFVAENFRRQRIGEVLMINIMQFARGLHGPVIFRLGALNWNESALQFYKQLGFGPSPNVAGTTVLIKKTA